MILNFGCRTLVSFASMRCLTFLERHLVYASWCKSLADRPREYAISCSSARRINRKGAVRPHFTSRRTTMSILSTRVFRLVVAGWVAATLVLAASQAQCAQISTQQRQERAQARLQKEVRH